MSGFVMVLLILGFQIVIYHCFIRPKITTWGASKKEAFMSMAGDSKALINKSTRVISIAANKCVVWRWLIQLGADRCGFFSYYFIERALGYKTRHQDKIEPEFNTIKVGDTVRGSVDEASSLIPYNFRVLDVEPEERLVLENWGTFLLQPVNQQETRLIIRTRENKPDSFFAVWISYIMLAFHYIMERRTLIGIKARIESKSGKPFSQKQDVLWFFGIVLSEIFICLLPFISKSMSFGVVIAMLLSLAWLACLFLCKPSSWYSLSLLVLCMVASGAIVKSCVLEVKRRMLI